MTEVLDRPSIKTTRDEKGRELEAAHALARELALKVALGTATEEEEQALSKTRDLIARTEEAISGLDWGLQEARRQSSERQAAENARQRHQAADELMALVEQRDEQTKHLDNALDAQSKALATIDDLGAQIRTHARELFGDVDTPGSPGRTFLTSVAAYDMNDIVEWYRTDVVNSVSGTSVSISQKRYSADALARRSTALNALATAVPDAGQANEIKEQAA